MAQWLQTSVFSDTDGLKRLHAKPYHTGLGFRLIVPGQNHVHTAARYPGAFPSWASVDKHLRWKKNTNTPWVSVYSTWNAALLKAGWYIREKGATWIEIAIFDLEKIHRDYVLDAPALRAHLGGPSQKYHNDEFLVYRGFRVEDIIMSMPVMGPTVDMPVWLGKMRLPNALIQVVGGHTEEAVRAWIETEVYCCTGVRDFDMALRILQGMCI